MKLEIFEKLGLINAPSSVCESWQYSLPKTEIYLVDERDFKIIADTCTTHGDYFKTCSCLILRNLGQEVVVINKENVKV